jgi:uncharacterized membrane protein YgcG
MDYKQLSKVTCSVQDDTSQDGALEAVEAYDDALPPPEPAVVIDEDVDPWWTANCHSQQDAGDSSNSSTNSSSGGTNNSGGGGSGGGGGMDHQPAGSGADMANDIKPGKDVP